MTELIDLNDLSKNAKILLLKELGFDSDGTYVLTQEGSRHLDKYTDEEILIENMLILPGSTIILSNNELSIASYLEEYGDVI